MISKDIIEMTYRYTILMIFNELIDVHTKIVEEDDEDDDMDPFNDLDAINIDDFKH